MRWWLESWSLLDTNIYCFFIFCRWQRSYTNSTICIHSSPYCRPCKRQVSTGWANHGEISVKKIAPHSIDWWPFSTMTTTGKICATIWRVWNYRAFRIWDCIWPIWCTLIARIRIPAAWNRNNDAPKWIISFASSRITRVPIIRTSNRYQPHRNTFNRFDTSKNCKISSKTINTSECAPCCPQIQNITKENPKNFPNPQKIIASRTANVCDKLIVGQQQQQRISAAHILSSQRRSIDNSIAQFVAGKIGDVRGQHSHTIRFDAVIGCNQIHSRTSKMSQSRLEVSVAVPFTTAVRQSFMRTPDQTKMQREPQCPLCIGYKAISLNMSLPLPSLCVGLCAYRSLRINNTEIKSIKLWNKPFDRFRSTSLPRNFHHGCTGLVLISRVATASAAVAKLPTSSSSSCQSNYNNSTSAGPISLSSKCKCRWVCFRPIASISVGWAIGQFVDYEIMMLWLNAPFHNRTHLHPLVHQFYFK